MDHHLFFVTRVMCCKHFQACCNALVTDLTLNVDPLGKTVSIMEYIAVARNELALVCQHFV